MGRVGIFVDNSVVAGETLADVGHARPYLYPYQIEDILSWSCTKPDYPSDFQESYFVIRSWILTKPRCCPFRTISGFGCCGIRPGYRPGELGSSTRQTVIRPTATGIRAGRSRWS